jgi:hypothetical protein
MAVAPESSQTTSDTAATVAAERDKDSDKDSDKAPAARFIAGIAVGSAVGSAPPTVPQPAADPRTPQPAVAAATAGSAADKTAGAAADKTGTPPARPSLTRTAAAAEPGTGGTEGALIGDVDRLRASWLRLQAGFVDDPYSSVTDAADLVEHAAQALVGALRQRQKMLRDAWSNEPGRPDTEQLRLVMQRYRALFNQICRP